MASSGSKKRSAPGTLPNLPTLTNPPNHQAQPMQRYPLQWPVPEASSSPTTQFNNQNMFNSLNMFDSNQNLQSNTQFGAIPQNISADNSPNRLELTRRPMSSHTNNQLVTTTPRKYDDFTDNSWTQFGDSNDQLAIDPQQPPQQQQQSSNSSDPIESLEQRADNASNQRKQIPPFVQKLWSFVDKPENNDLIRWSERGDSFVVLDEDEFAKKLIPELFKHNNYASFVRQLNMYGFHKKVGLSDNSMKASEKKNKSPSEYSNPYFRRGHPKLLWLIEKPKAGPHVKKGAKKIKMGDGDGGSDDEVDALGNTHSFGDNSQFPMQQQRQRAITAIPESADIALQKKDMSIVLSDIQNKQQQMSSAISRLRTEHNDLFTQAMRFQNQHDKHESSINAILTFLATVYRNNVTDGQGLNMSQLFANVAQQDQQQPQQRGNVVDMTDSYQQDQAHQQQTGNISPLRRPQRLLMAPPAHGNSRSASPMTSRTSTTTPQPIQHPQFHTSASIEELLDSPSESPKIKAEDLQDPNSQMLNLINNTNASADMAHGGQQGSAQNDLEVLSNEISSATSPLTPSQCNVMLQMMAKQTPGSGSALISPSPPPLLNLDLLNREANELQNIADLQNSIDADLNQVAHAIQPLSPSGVIPGFTDVDGGLFDNNSFMSNGLGGDLDMDQFLNYSQTDNGAYWDNGVLDGGTYDNSNAEGAVGGERIIEEADTPE